MKRFIIVSVLLLSALYSRAQQGMAFPFQGGKEVMMDFFKKNVVIPEELQKRKATGTAVLKFSADEKGVIQKIVVYYADDYIVALPFIEALRKSSNKWVIPDGEKLHDFLISCTINLALPANQASPTEQKQIYEAYKKRQPVWASNPIPLDMTSLLPAIITSY